MENSTTLTLDTVETDQTIRDFPERFQEIGNKVYSARNLDDILINLNGDITALFDVEKTAIYSIDDNTRELVHKYRSGTRLSTQRIPITRESVPGYVVIEKKTINIGNADDSDELQRIDGALKIDAKGYKKENVKTKQILATPILYQNVILGAIELINTSHGAPFSDREIHRIDNLATILGISLYSQYQTSAVRVTKFGYLVENNLISKKGLKLAIAEAKKRNQAEADVLVGVYKVSKKDIGKSLSRYYGVSFVEFNPNMAIPGELLAGLKIPFMRNNYWVPISYYEKENKVTIAIDDPHDLQKIDVIQTLFKGKKIGFNVALQEDILEIINLFTRSEKELAGIDDIISQLSEEAEEIEEAEAAVGEEDSAVV